MLGGEGLGGRSCVGVGSRGLGRERAHGYPAGVTVDPIELAIAQGRRQAEASDRDITGAVDHFATVLRPTVARWGLQVDHLLGGGAGMPTLAVTTADGRPAVLKIAEPGAMDHAVQVMRAAHGRGYVHVLGWDPSHGALLTERLGADLWTESTNLIDQARVVVPLLRQAWEVPLGVGRQDENKAQGLAGILENLGPRYGNRHQGAVARARQYAEELAATERPEVVCHGDPHPGNVLRRGDGWALIDPDGFVGERAYDLGVVLRDGCRELLAERSTGERGSGDAAYRRLREASRLLAELAGDDEDRVWRWGFVERVTTGLYLAWFGYAEESGRFLDSAALLAAHC